MTLQIVTHQGAVHIEGGLLRARDESHCVAHHVLDRRRHQRVVGAPQHQGVNLCLLERRQVLLCNREQLGAAGHPCLHELHKTWAGLREELEIGCRGEGVLVRLGLDRPNRADHTYPAIPGLAHRGADSGLDHLHHGDAIAIGEALTGIPEHRRRRGVAGDHEELYSLRDEVVHHGERVPTNLGDGLGAVGRMNGIPHVQNRLMGQLVDDGACHGESTYAAVEDSNGRVGHAIKPILGRMSTALLTDRYELTMLDAAIGSGMHNRECVFEVFARRLPEGRRYGIVAGTGRLLDEIERFRFEDAELTWLRDNGVVGQATLDWLANYRFRGSISGYREGETFFPGSPILVVDGTFAEAVILETLVLSVLNYDSAVASAAARMVSAAQGRPLAEMGSRRANERAAVAAARAAYIAGFGATSNLEAGRTYGIPTMGTAAHSFTLLHNSEEDAFRAQVAALGPGTTLLVDTYDITNGVDLAVKVAGTTLGAVRIDSGDLPVQVAAVRAQLDALGATSTRITVTNDLDEFTIAALRAAPVDSYGVGTSVVTGSGHPAAGLVYKLVAHRDDAGDWVSVAKKSAAKATVGGRKAPVRTLENGVAVAETIHIGEDASAIAGRPLLVPLVTDGVIAERFRGREGAALAREHCARAVAELPADALRLGRGEPAIPTVYA